MTARRLSAEELASLLRSVAAQSPYAVDYIRAHIEALEAELSYGCTCSTCGGSPHPSGLECVCGGSGLASAEAQGLRVDRERLRAENERLRWALRTEDYALTVEHERAVRFESALVRIRNGRFASAVRRYAADILAGRGDHNEHALLGDKPRAALGGKP